MSISTKNVSSIHSSFTLGKVGKKYIFLFLFSAVTWPPPPHPLCTELRREHSPSYTSSANMWTHPHSPPLVEYYSSCSRRRSSSSCSNSSFLTRWWLMYNRPSTLTEWYLRAREKEPCYGISRACRSLPLSVRLLFYRPTSPLSQGMNHALSLSLSLCCVQAFICNSFSSCISPCPSFSLQHL